MLIFRRHTNCIQLELDIPYYINIRHIYILYIYVYGKQKYPESVPLHKICWHQDNLILDENPSRCPSIEQ
jgi:hypothetical protein